MKIVKSLLCPQCVLLSVALTLNIAGCKAQTPATTARAAALPAPEAPATTAPTVTIRLSEAKRALLPIVVSTTATPTTKAAAATLADYLERISGAKFEVKTGDGASGIAIGTASEFPDLPLAKSLDAADVTQREDYVLRSHAGGLTLIGATDLAVQHAVWDVLYRLGYRQYFPGKNWEIIPSSPALSLAVDMREHPDYLVRQLAFGRGWPGGEDGKDVDRWEERNRLGAGLKLMSSHSYDRIYAAKKAEFDAHPEYVCSTKPIKFCISNAGLRQLVVDYALEYFEKNPDADSISMDPSDGGGWECADCEDDKKFNSITDRVVTLANQVAEAVNQKYQGKYVGIYAYGFHSPPPTIRVHPNVVVSVATAFIKDGYSVDELAAEWQKQGATIGVREYYSVFDWDHEMPGRSRGANLGYLATTIPNFYNKGARFMISETGGGWGANGPGLFLASRALWDVKEAARADEIQAEFIDKSFGAAREPMRQFYQLMNGANNVPLSDDLVGRLYRHLAEAEKLAGNDAAIRARLNDLALYLRYVELYRDYDVAPNKKEKAAALEATLRHVYRMSESNMVISAWVYRMMTRRDAAPLVPANAERNIAAKDNPWKEDRPFTAAEISGFIQTGIAQNKLLAFTPVRFSDDLVPATPLNLPEVKAGAFGVMRGKQSFVTWIANGQLKLTATAGLVYDWKGAAQLTLTSPLEVTLEPVATGEVAPDKTAREIELKTPYQGVHRLLLEDERGGTLLANAPGEPLSLEASQENPALIGGRWDLYFYVPKGTKVVGGFAGGQGNILDGSGKIVYKLPVEASYFNVPVPAGQDGKLWQFGKSLGQRALMTVPPYLARSGDELLLPREVVERDAK